MAGILGSIIIGAIAGWLASLIMKKNNGLLVNIILGIVGGFVGGFVFGLVGFGATNIIGQIIVAVVGACIVVAIYNAIKKQ
ncbi:MAG: GlsB/YeaQ/YmgE family stress response membrane protein [Lachnospiraceae bacterium]|jgi:uncharacterized membrane protein YeaQ/YmgE (transglycosylase-associated protein family)|nr:GlsB/YeaQ/YmgE family stress response membrane protein [Lachnospiraceae bacterium]